ncbi:MAG: hypothetical protein FJY99_00765 [Candidatus Sericytochromatia bacterium]|nr:hypothetical protein [Candidatus Tanganyikabacteria bacterium]
MAREVLYSVRLGSFQDSDGDGVGDLAGLRHRLDHIASLGATVIWLLPIHPSPGRDDGYDAGDYFAIDLRLGSLEAFRTLVEAVHQRGMRLILDLVLNHTSVTHPSFVRARHAPADHPDRVRYVWSPSPERYRGARVIFPEEEPGNWTRDEVAGAWYWHRFYREQPDLNWTHLPVMQAMKDVLDHWLDLGVDGFRLDALPYLPEAKGTPCEGLPETHATLQDLAAHVRGRRPDAILLGEANGTTEAIRAYFGEGRGYSHMLDFRRMTVTWLAVAREEVAPLATLLATDQVLPEGCQWATFPRNHDELTTEHLDEEDRNALLTRFAPRGSQRRFGGIRRRPASLAADALLWRLLHGMWLLGPGCPVIWYGDEIAMAEVPGLPDRMGLRTPMLWDEGPSAGFSRLPPEDLPLKLGTARGGLISRQSETSRSALGRIRRLLAIRRAYP